VITNHLGQNASLLEASAARKILFVEPEFMKLELSRFAMSAVGRSNILVKSIARLVEKEAESNDGGTN